METFKPTEEQLTDFFCGDLDDDILQSKIETYLKTHPELAQEMQDWKTLESVYLKAQVFGPSQLALENVRQNALDAIATPPSFFGSLFAPNNAKRLVMSFSILFLAGVSFALTRLWIPIQTGQQVDFAKNADTTLQTSHLASTTTTDSTTVVATTDATLEAWANEEFKAAILAYQQEQYDTANQKFAGIITRYANFSENKKLYTYWIESLKKLGQYDLAAEKKAALDLIP